MSLYNITDTPLNLSTTNNSDKVFSKLPEHKCQNFQAGCKVWTVKTPPIVPDETFSSTDGTDRVASTSEGSMSPNPSRSPFTERPFGPFQVSPLKHRGPKHPVPEEMKDERYFKRRRRNNEAAKRSRLARKERQEAELNRIASIELENSALRTQMLSLRAEYETLAQILLRRRELLSAALLRRHENTAVNVGDVTQEVVN